MRILIRAALLLASVVLILGAVEVTLRTVYPQFGGCDFGQPDAELHAVLKANYAATCIALGHESVTDVRTNALGLRQGVVVVPRPASLHRIMLLGDSTTFGIGVHQDETVPAFLETDLRAWASDGVVYEVINAAVPGYGTAQEWLLYKRLAGLVDPEVVVLLFLTTNDVQDNLCEDGRKAPCFVLTNDGTLVIPEVETVAVPAPAASWRGPGLDSLHFWVFLRSRLSKIATENPLVANLLRRTGWQARLPLPTTVAAWYETPRSTRGWALTRALLDRLADEVRAAGKTFVVAVLPARPQTTPQLAALVDALYGDRPEGAAFRTEPDRPQQWLKHWAADAHVPVVDLLPALREAAATTRINLQDGHFNAKGNAIIAREIGRTLADCCLPSLRGGSTDTARFRVTPSTEHHDARFRP